MQIFPAQVALPYSIPCQDAQIKLFAHHNFFWIPVSTGMTSETEAH
jgi:hypothetical protein